MNIVRDDIRNIAIIAHVDHGKTTLVDEMLKQGGVFRKNQQVAERVMDSNDLERERGITILSKNTAVHYEGVKHQHRRYPRPRRLFRRGGARAQDGQRRAAAGGRLRRPHAADALCAQKGAGTEPARSSSSSTRSTARTRAAPRWWTRRWNCSWSWTPPTNSSTAPSSSPPAATGTATTGPGQCRARTCAPLFDAILTHIPAPEGDPDAPLQLLISTIDYNDYVGRIGVGRIERGTHPGAGRWPSAAPTASSFTSPASAAGRAVRVRRAQARALRKRPRGRHRGRFRL